MSLQKKSLALIFGGKSAEHDISILSAQNVLSHIDHDRYQIMLIAIDKEGKWFLHHDGAKNPYQTQGKTLSLEGFDQKIMMTLDGTGRFYIIASDTYINVDIIHPILHGPFGEDGAIQGLFKMAQIPFVGPSVLGSAAGMDKEIMKRILRDNGIKVGDFLTARKQEEYPSFQFVEATLSLPVFVKPANMGSSIGISKVHTSAAYEVALKEAFRYDEKIIIEANISGREIECAVLGNENPKASLPGEIILQDEFYGFDTKYIDDDGAKIQVPAQLSSAIVDKMQEIAIKTFKVLSCEGLGRVDFFLTTDDTIYVNEINTLPGFTSISMYPVMWEASGLPYKELLNTLYDLAIARYTREK